MTYLALSLTASLSASLLLSQCQPKAPETQVPSTVEGESARFEQSPPSAPANPPSSPPASEPNEAPVDEPTDENDRAEEPTEYPGLPTSNNPRFNKPRGN